MIYTVGYAALDPSRLLTLVSGLRVDLVIDVRSVPVSRRPGFGRRQLERLLGARYEWRGDELGGLPASKRPRAGLPAELPGLGLAALERLARDERNLMLMCVEEAPGDCHRHHTIAVPLLRRHGVDARHIYRREVFTAGALQVAIDNDTEYDCAALAF